MPRARARVNNISNAMFDQTMHRPEEAIAAPTDYERSQTETSALLSNDDHIIDEAMDDDYVPPLSPPLSHIERLERMRELRLNQLVRHEDEQQRLLEQAMIEARAARLQARKERRAKQAMRTAMIEVDPHQDSQQQQDESILNTESVDATKTQRPRRRRPKRQRHVEYFTDQEARPMRAVATGANSVYFPQAGDTRMDVDVSASMEQPSVLLTSETPDIYLDRTASQQETHLGPHKAKSSKNKQRDPQQHVEDIATTLLSRMQKTVAKLIAGGLSSEEAQQTAIAGEHKRAEDIASRRQIKSAKIANPIERERMQARHARSYEHAQTARRMVLEPGFLTPEEAAAFDERVQNKLLKNNQRHIHKARSKLDGTTTPCNGKRASKPNYSSTIGILQRNLENTRNTFGTQSDQYLNFKFMVEETIKELEAKLATRSQPAAEQEQSTVRQPADETLYHDNFSFVIADRSIVPSQGAAGTEHPTTVLQDAQALPPNDDDDNISSSNDDHDDYDDDDYGNEGGVGLGMNADDTSDIGADRDRDGTVSAAQARAEDESHLQALRALLSEISLHGQ